MLDARPQDSPRAFSSLIVWIKREMVQESQITCSSFVLLRQPMCTLNLSNRDFSWWVQDWATYHLSFRFKLHFLSLEIQPTNASTYNFHALLISWIRYFKPRDVIWLVQQSFIEFFIVLEGKQRVNICNMSEQVTNSIRYSQIILIDIEEKNHWN